MKWKELHTTEDWADWVPIPVEEYYAELDYCRKNDIPIRIDHLRDTDTGQEFMMVLKKIELPKPGCEI
jgi:hypothetical protein